MIDINYKAQEQRSVALDGDREIGECTYLSDGKIWTINHTFVSPEYGGQGIAKSLVERLVAEARQAGVGLAATCSYAVRLFEKTNAYDDVVVK